MKLTGSFPTSCAAYSHRTINRYVPEGIFRAMATSMQNFCPFLTTIDTAPKTRISTQEKEKFESKCPFGKMMKTMTPQMIAEHQLFESKNNNDVCGAQPHHNKSSVKGCPLDSQTNSDSFGFEWGTGKSHSTYTNSMEPIFGALKHSTPISSSKVRTSARRHFHSTPYREIHHNMELLSTAKIYNVQQQRSTASSADIFLANDGKIPFIPSTQQFIETPKFEMEPKRESIDFELPKKGVTRSDIQHKFATTIKNLKDNGNYRVFNHIDRKAGSFPLADNRLDIIPGHVPETEVTEDMKHYSDIAVWCNNDYLGMGQNPIVLKAMKNAIDRFGAGSGGTRNISGTSSLHVQLEKELAQIHQKEAALLFSSCYAANASAIPTLCKVIGSNVVLFSDAKNHASLIEGIKNANVTKKVFRHNDVAHLRQLLEETDANVPKMIIFESVYSMDGTISPIRQICDLADEFSALTFIDEVHAVGLYGKNGGGIAERENLLHRLDIVSGTLGKAFGLYGGYIAANYSIIDSLRSLCPGFIFTTSVPPVIVAGALESVRYLRQSQVERETASANARYLKDSLKAAGLPVMDTASHIVPLIVGDARICKKMSENLLKNHGIYVQPINYPTVAKGTERFRLVATPVHSKEEIDRLTVKMIQLWKEFDPPRPSQELLSMK